MIDKLQIWIDKLSEQQLPAFAHTARSLAYVSRENDSSAEDLSNIILHDTAMTARILRIANSAHYNPTGKPIKTVSYATVVLGFEQVRNIALTIAMIDTVLDAEPQQQLQMEMVSAYHAAVQAQRLAKKSDPEALEAIYIAALLNRLGSIIFWCFPFGKGNELLDAYRENDSGEQAERRVLGFSLNDLTGGLISEWNLSEMLRKSMMPSRKQEQEQAIAIGSGIANGISRGWLSDTVEKQIKRAGVYLSVPVVDAKKHVYASARVAAEGLKSFGFPQIHSLLPPNELNANDMADKEQALKLSKFQDELEILGRLTHMLSQFTDLNVTLMAVLEGIHHALKMDQVVFALVNAKTYRLQAKRVIGNQWDATTADAQIDIMNILKGEQSTGKLVKQLFTVGQPMWHTARQGEKYKPQDLDPLLRKLAAKEFLLHPILLKQTPVGLVYGARKQGEESFTENEFQSFCRMADYSTVAFALLAQKKSATQQMDNK